MSQPEAIRIVLEKGLLIYSFLTENVMWAKTNFVHFYYNVVLWHSVSQKHKYPRKNKSKSCCQNSKTHLCHYSIRHNKFIYKNNI